MSEPAVKLEPVTSPCVNVCRLDENDMCVGCFRTSREIAEWLSYTPGQRAEIIERLPARAESRFD